VAEVLTVAINKDAAIITNILRVPAAEVGVEEGVRQPTQCLHRCHEVVSADVEVNLPSLCLPVLLHGCDVTL
jgi:hypothetical protein